MSYFSNTVLNSLKYVVLFNMFVITYIFIIFSIPGYSEVVQFPEILPSNYIKFFYNEMDITKSAYNEVIYYHVASK